MEGRVKEGKREWEEGRKREFIKKRRNERVCSALPSTPPPRMKKGREGGRGMKEKKKKKNPPFEVRFYFFMHFSISREGVGKEKKEEREGLERKRKGKKKQGGSRRIGTPLIAIMQGSKKGRGKGKEGGKKSGKGEEKKGLRL